MVEQPMQLLRSHFAWLWHDGEVGWVEREGGQLVRDESTAVGRDQSAVAEALTCTLLRVPPAERERRLCSWPLRLNLHIFAHGTLVMGHSHGCTCAQSCTYPRVAEREREKEISRFSLFFSIFCIHPCVWPLFLL